MSGRLVDRGYQTASGQLLPVRVPRPRSEHETFWRWVGYLGLAVAVVLLALWPGLPGLILLLFAGMVAVAFHMLRHSFREPSALDVLAGDAPAPVVYLRRFSDDLSITQFLSARHGSFEEALCQAFKSVGPVVTVGRPGEKGTSGRGAARLYVAHEHWQDVVADLICRARVVILRAGTSSGILWELKQTFGQLRPEQIVVFLTPGFGPLEGREPAYRRFLEWAQPHIPAPLPEQIGNGVLIYFDRHRHAHLLTPGDPEAPAQGHHGPRDHPLAPQLAEIASSDVFVPPDYATWLPIVLIAGVLLLAILLS